MSADKTPIKRAAFESPATLLKPLDRDPHMRRPSTITAGTVLVLLRIVAGVLVLIGLWLNWPMLVDDADAILGEDTFTPEEEQLAVWVAITFGAIVLLVELTVVLFLWRGRNWARVLVMIFAVISTSGAFTAWVLREQEITLNTTLLAVGLDVLILLALSSRSAAAYARRFEKP